MLSFQRAEPLRWPMTVTGIPWNLAMPPRMARVLPALAVAALLEEIGEQGVDRLVDMGAARVPGQKDPVLRRQRAAAAEELILHHGQLRQLGRIGGNGVHLAVLIGGVAAQGGDLLVEGSQLFQKFFNHRGVFLPLRGAAAAGSASRAARCGAPPCPQSRAPAGTRCAGSPRAGSRRWSAQ